MKSPSRMAKPGRQGEGQRQEKPREPKSGGRQGEVPQKKPRLGSRARKKRAKLTEGDAELAPEPTPTEPEPARASADDGDSERRPERYAFAACDADHAETPRLAYEHLAPLLHRLAAQLGKSAADLHIYDPYYCAGSVVRHLSALGFPRVHNANEDFYARVRARDLPPFDVLVTNPPYTADHVERLLGVCASVRQPCCLLLPSYVYTKPFYAASAFGALAPCYLAPPCRYKYRSPPGAANAAGLARKSGSGSSGQVTAPFTSFWYLKFESEARADLEAWWGSDSAAGAHQGCVLARSAAELPHAMRDAADPSRKRLGRGEREAQLAQRRAKDGRRLCTACGQVWGECRHTRG